MDSMEQHNVRSEEERCLEILADHIRNNCTAVVTLKELTSMTNLSRHTCIKLFRKYLNTTPAEYARKCRVERVSYLLKHTDKSIGEISNDCGMDISYFSRTFREATGYTPMEYRRNYYRSRQSKE